MKRAIVLQHAEFEGPGRISEMVLDLGYRLECRALFRGDAVPSRLERDDLLIVMGGPMGVADRDRSELSFLERELGLLQRCIADDAPVLGVCLGAQLLAHAAGSRVYPITAEGGALRLYEVGWGKITFLSESLDESLAGLPTEAELLHWHGDTFDLPRAAKLLASSTLCPNQAFRLGRRGFGLQFHCEVDQAQVETFLRADAAFVERANGSDGVAQLRSDTSRCIGRAREVGEILLRNMLRNMSSP